MQPPSTKLQFKVGSRATSLIFIWSSTSEVCVFVEQLEIPSDAFRKNSVNGEDLLELSDKDLIQELAMIVNVGMSSSISNKFY